MNFARPAVLHVCAHMSLYVHMRAPVCVWWVPKQACVGRILIGAAPSSGHPPTGSSRRPGPASCPGNSPPPLPGPPGRWQSCDCCHGDLGVPTHTQQHRWEVAGLPWGWQGHTVEGQGGPPSPGWRAVSHTWVDICSFQWCSGDDGDDDEILEDGVCNGAGHLPHNPCRWVCTAVSSGDQGDPHQPDGC